MLILHESTKIKKNIRAHPERYSEHVEDITRIEKELNHGLHSRFFVVSLLMYAYDKFLEYKGIDHDKT